MKISKHKDDANYVSEVISQAVEDSVVTKAEQKKIVDTVLEDPRLKQSPIYKLLEFGFYFVEQLLSFVENQTLRTLFAISGISRINFILTFFFGIVFGHIANRLAIRRYKKDRGHLDLPFDFMDRFLYLRFSAIYSLALNILFYLVFFIIESIL